jgi:hypothetical protein
MIIKRNWRDAHPTIAHESGVDWRLLSSVIKTSGDIEEPEMDPKVQMPEVHNICLICQIAA